MRRKRYTYIPQEEIAELTTYNNVTFTDKDLLDGAYVRGIRKFRHGGVTHKSAEQQAMEVVGDQWFKMNESDRAEIVEDLMAEGLVTGMFAHGGTTRFDGGGIVYKIKYSTADAPDKLIEKTFDSKDDADLFFEVISDDEDFIVKPIEEVKPAKVAKPKPAKLEVEAPKASIFSSAKAKPTTTKSKIKRDRVQVDGIADDIARYNQLKETIKNATAEKELINGRLTEAGKEVFLEMYEETGRKPENFDLADGEEEVIFMVTEKYLKVEPEKAEMLREYGLLQEQITYEFNTKILEKELPSGKTIGEVINMLIQDTKLLPEDVKQELIQSQLTQRVAPRSIDRIMEFDNPREVYELIAPVTAIR